MWPWEHVLFAYVCYSSYGHLRWRKRPDDTPTAALAFGAVLPDLIDKPLAWQFGVFESGRALAHSVFVVVPVVAAVFLYAKRHGHGSIGAAYGIGHLLHIAGDVLPASLGSGGLDLTPMLWPIASSPQGADLTSTSLLDGALSLLVGYVAKIATLSLTPAIGLQIGSLLIGLVLWASDGFPGPGFFVEWVRAGRRRASHRR